MILQKWENNGTEEIGLVTPTPEEGIFSQGNVYPIFIEMEKLSLWQLYLHGRLSMTM